ncbi:putative phage abortive infection protein [Cronobacter dublinensis]
MIRFIILISVVFMFCYGYALSHDIWPFEGMDENQRGVFGDSWGAFTSIFSAMGFCGVLWTIKLQMDATKKLEDDAKKREQAGKVRDFENTFFNMLNIIQSLIGGMQVVDRPHKKILAEGRGVFLYFYKNFKTYVVKEKNGLVNYKDLSEANQNDVASKLGAAYELYFSNRSQNLSHYYRFLFNTYKFIDESDLQHEIKRKYANILRAQLSNYELVMLFYNAQASYGAKFIKYFEKYQVLDNTPVKKLISLKHVRLISINAWGDNPLALKMIKKNAGHS